jgi:hypothetical protein
MSATGLAAFDPTLRTTHVWLNDIGEEVGWDRYPRQASRALGPPAGASPYTTTEPAGGPMAVATQMASDIRQRHRGLIRALRIEVVAGGVVLHGQANTFYGKQMAQHEVMRRSVVVVANRIVVVR